tara:strand:+ start:284 stop:643 length:360 start_codon:yes stop_codon:yes gene_type:complete
MSLNNTNLKFNNQTEFVPANPTKFTNTMTTHDHLAAAEKELRLALASVVETASPVRLTRLIHVLDTVNDIKQGFVSDESTTDPAPNFVINTPDTVDYGYGAAGPVDFPSTFGQDVITFS